MHLYSVDTGEKGMRFKYLSEIAIAIKDFFFRKQGSLLFLKEWSLKNFQVETKNKKKIKDK